MREPIRCRLFGHLYIYVELYAPMTDPWVKRSRCVRCGHVRVQGVASSGEQDAAS